MPLHLAHKVCDNVRRKLQGTKQYQISLAEPLALAVSAVDRADWYVPLCQAEVSKQTTASVWCQHQAYISDRHGTAGNPSLSSGHQ